MLKLDNITQWMAVSNLMFFFINFVRIQMSFCNCQINEQNLKTPLL